MARIVVIGAGVLGASAAYDLSRKTRSTITVLDCGQPASAASGTSLACLNFGHANRAYTRLRAAFIEAYPEVVQRLGQHHLLNTCGTLRWTDDPADSARSGGAELLVQGGYRVEQLSRKDAARLEPEVKWFSVVEPVIRVPVEAAVDCAQLTHAFLRFCKTDLPTGVKVTGIDQAYGRPRVWTTQGSLETDCVVLAVGSNTTRLARTIGLDIPVISQGGILARFAAPRLRLHSIVYGPGLHARLDGAGAPLAGGEDVENDAPSAERVKAGADIFAERGRRWITSCDCRVQSASIAYRPIPADGLPVIGRASSIPSVYILATHGGATLAPLLGAIGTDELLDARDDERVSKISPNRFLRTSPPGERQEDAHHYHGGIAR